MYAPKRAWRTVRLPTSGLVAKEEDESQYFSEQHKKNSGPISSVACSASRKFYTFRRVEKKIKFQITWPSSIRSRLSNIVQLMCLKPSGFRGKNPIKLPRSLRIEYCSKCFADDSLIEEIVDKINRKHFPANRKNGKFFTLGISYISIDYENIIQQQLEIFTDY